MLNRKDKKIIIVILCFAVLIGCSCQNLLQEGNTEIRTAETEVFGKKYECIYDVERNYFLLRDIELDQVLLDSELNWGLESLVGLDDNLIVVESGIGYSLDEKQLYSFVVNEEGTVSIVKSSDQLPDSVWEMFQNAFNECNALETEIQLTYDEETSQKMISLVFMLKDQPQKIFEAARIVFDDPVVIRDVSRLYLKVNSCHALVINN